jgi:hypothetical protein
MLPGGKVPALGNLIIVNRFGIRALRPTLRGLVNFLGRPTNVAAVALANKNAHIVWAMLAGNVSYEPARSVQAA